MDEVSKNITPDTENRARKRARNTEQWGREKAKNARYVILI